MTQRVEITYFPRLCAHGLPLRWVERRGGGSHWEGREGVCSGCMAEAEAEADEQDLNFEAFVQRRRGRVKKS